MRATSGRVLAAFRLVLGLALLTGCATAERAQPPTPGDAWQQRENRRAAQPSAPPAENLAPVDRAADDAAGAVPNGSIATVNGRDIPRARMINLLLRAHGPALLEQFIILEAAESLAAREGLSVTSAEVEGEYERALRRLSDPLAALAPDAFDRAAAERLLGSVLSERNISHEEFQLGMRRNALLRRIVHGRLTVSEAQLRQEYERRFARRVKVRDILLASLGDVARVEERLRAGEDFAEAARRYSASTVGARLGGLLDPFSANDDLVPGLLREAAFRLEPGQVSTALRVGNWYHLIKVERHLPAESPDFAAVRATLEQTVHERLAEPAMEELNEQLFRDAVVEIHDPVLREVFQRRYPDTSE